MNAVFVITRSAELANSISRYFRYLLCLETHVLHPPMKSRQEQHVVIHDFQRIADWIESKGSGGEGIILRNAVAFIDLFDTRLDGFDELDPLALNNGNWSATVAMLVLSFPEIQWVFNTPYKTPSGDLFRAAHLLGEGNLLKQIMEVHDSDYTALFDPTGLRQAIRHKVAETKEAVYIPQRFHVATAIDEEDDYAYFNGYMAYRLGYRCYVISSYRMMRRVLRRPPDPVAVQAAASSQSNGSRKRLRNKLKSFARTRFRRRKSKQENGRPDLQQVSENGHSDEHVTLIFEDLYLNFPDHRDPRLSLSNLEVRSEQFKALDDQRRRAQFRAFVTVGHDITANKNQARDNEIFKKKWEAQAEERKVGNVLKPVSGFFHLWEESGFMKWSRKFSWRGYAAGYVWPPVSGEELTLRQRFTQLATRLRSFFKREQIGSPGQETAGVGTDADYDENPIAVSAHDTFYTGHSALGRLLEIAERLIYRGEMNSEHIHTVADAIYGATLALDAQEYLGHRTPTTSLQALALKHKFEVSAECLFYGVAQNKEVKKRFGEINKEVVSIGKWLNPTTRKAAQFDAELGIISKLMLVFRQNYQFDEEQECLKKIRHLNRRLWCRKVHATHIKKLRSLKAPVAALTLIIHPWLHLGRWYVDKLINSLVWFAGWIAAWLVVFSALYGFWCGCIDKSEFHPSERWAPLWWQTAFYKVEQGVMHAMTAFFGLQAPHDVNDLETYGPVVVAVTVAAIALGFVHLGIFVSHVYSVISRR